MIILDNPYVSVFLINTIKENNFSVLDNEISRQYFDKSFLTSTQEAIEKYYGSDELFYTNSENSINWIFENLKNSHLKEMITICKDKADFREKLAKIYPNYFFQKCKLENLKEIDVNFLRFPLILKPTVGFLSFGVYSIQNEEEWKQVLEKINSDIEKIKGIFPEKVVNTSDFIIEEMIEGEEFALDAYFDKNGRSVILNIFNHPFFNDKDVSDRIYYSSKIFFEKYYEKFKNMLDKIGAELNFKNFPFHIELRANETSIIPIEINPLRFCGWCITDIANYSWGVNPYEYFIKQQKPNWEEILKNTDSAYYYFTIGDIPSDINKKNIKGIDFEKYLKNIQNPLTIRKIDYKTKPVFAISFAKTNSLDEIKNILKLDMKDFIIQ